MSDSNASAGQDDATTDITPERFNGLMSAYQRTQAELAALKAGGSAQAPGSDTAAQGGSPGLEDGMYEVVDGQLQPFEGPTPRGNNPRRELRGRPRDDGSPEAALAEVSRALGGTPQKTSWP